MPASILTQSERNRYGQLPAQIEESSLRQFFYFNQEDKYFIWSFSKHSTKRNGLLILQVGIVRFLGYLPDAWKNQLSDEYSPS